MHWDRRWDVHSFRYSVKFSQAGTGKDSQISILFFSVTEDTLVLDLSMRWNEVPTNIFKFLLALQVIHLPNGRWISGIIRHTCDVPKILSPSLPYRVSTLFLTVGKYIQCVLLLKCAVTSIVYNRISPKFSHVVETNVRNNGTVISSRNVHNFFR